MIALAIVGCEKNEDITTIERISQQQKNPYNISRIGKSEILQNKTIAQKLDKIKEDLAKGRVISNAKVVYSTDYDFYIDTDYATYIESEDGNYHSYTFPVFRVDANGLLENLLLTLQADGSYKAFIASYDLTEQEIEELNNELYVDIENRFTFVEINGTNIIHETFSKTTSNCFLVTTSKCAEGNVDHMGGYYPNGDICPAHESVTVEYCPDATGGSAYENESTTTSNVGDGTVGSCEGCGGSGSQSNIWFNVTNITTTQSWQNVLNCAEGLLQVDGAVELLIDNKPLATEFEDFLDNNCTTEAQAFAELAVEALDNDGIDDGEVDFEEGIIYAIDNICQRIIVMDASNNCSPINQAISSAFEGNDDYTLVYSNAVNVDPVTNADTSGSCSGNGTDMSCSVNIKLRTAYLESATNLGIARTVIHENVHALLLYLQFTGAISTNSSDPEFVELAQAFVDFQASNSPDNDGTPEVFEALQHEYMTDLVGDMATALSEYGASKGLTLSPNYYIKLVWGSLQTTNTYQTQFNNFEKQEIEAIFYAEQYNENRTYYDINGIEQTITKKGTPAASAVPCE